MEKVKRKEFIDKHFSFAEIEELCFDLDLPYEDIKQDTKNNTILKLIDYCERHGRTVDLETKIVNKRPFSTNGNFRANQQNKKKKYRIVWIVPLILISILVLLWLVTSLIKPDEKDNYNQGLSNYNQGNYEEAIDDFTKAINLNSNDPLAYYNRGLAYRELDKNSEAISDFSQTIRLDPEYTLAYYNLGLAHRAQDNPSDAVDDFTNALALGQEDAAVYFNRGLAYRTLNNLDMAIDDFTEALALDPENEAAYYNRALIYREQGNSSAAVDDFQLYLEVAPNASDRSEIIGLINELTETAITCHVVVGEILLDKQIISTEDDIDVSVKVENLDNVPVLYNWHATSGSLEPGLRTRALQSTYTPPSDPTDDVIFLDVEADGCDLIERTAKIRILKPSEITETPTPISLPSKTPTLFPSPTVPPTNTPTPTEIPMLMIESFENYAESLLREDFSINTNAGNEGSLRLVGVPHTKGGVVALAFDYEIKNSGTGKNYIGFERLFPAQDWSDYTSFCVWVEGDGSNRDIVMQFGETGQEWKYTTPLSQIGIGELCVPINDISNANLRNIGYFGIFIEGSEGPPSTIYFDNIRVQKTQ